MRKRRKKQLVIDSDSDSDVEIVNVSIRNPSRVPLSDLQTNQNQQSQESPSQSAAHSDKDTSPTTFTVPNKYKPVLEFKKPTLPLVKRRTRPSRLKDKPNEAAVALLSRQHNTRFHGSIDQKSTRTDVEVKKRGGRCLPLSLEEEITGETGDLLSSDEVSSYRQVVGLTCSPHDLAVFCCWGHHLDAITLKVLNQLSYN